MKVNFEQSGAVGVLTIDGDLTISNAGALKEALLKSLDNVEHLVLNIDKVNEIDIAGLQLLCSAHRTLSRLNKQLTVANTHAKAYRQAVKDAGYSRHVGCSYDSGGNCLWRGGND